MFSTSENRSEYRNSSIMKLLLLPHLFCEPTHFAVASYHDSSATELCEELGSL